MKLKVLLVIIVCYCHLIAHPKADCFIESPLGAPVRPKFFRNTTTQTALIENQNQWIYLEDNEDIIGHCKTSFTNPISGYSKVEIYCENSNIKARTVDYYGYSYPSSNVFECTPEKIFGTCSISPSLDRSVRPKFFKKLGTRTMQISSEIQSIQMQYDQELTARCDTKFKSPNHLSSELNLICINGKIVALGHPYESSYNSFECESLQWNLYESATSFPWCPSSMASYILARPWVNNDFEYLAGICYNFEEMSFKSLYYAAKPKFVKYLSPAILITYEPLMEIPEINTNFISEKTFMYDNPQIDQWITFSNYKNESIVQNRNLYNDMFQQFDQLLNIDWWSGLQLGNWKFYEEALARHIESDDNKYDILAGISDAVAAPTRTEGCDKNHTMVELVDTENNKLPLYIWNYLKSTRNESDEVVVIGVNSPFYDFYEEKDIVFCNDICHQLDWLENIHSTFRYRPMGVIFCCSVDEVIASERLDGFEIPRELIPPAPLPVSNYNFIYPDTTTIESVATTVYDETTERNLEYDEYGNLY